MSRGADIRLRRQWERELRMKQQLMSDCDTVSESNAMPMRASGTGSARWHKEPARYERERRVRRL